MAEKTKGLWIGDYITLFDDKTIGVSDGVGFVGEETDLEGLYKALKELFEKKKD